MIPPNTLEQSAWLRLTLPFGVTFASQRKLLRRFGNVECVLGASHAALAALIGEEGARALNAGPAPDLLDRTLRWLGEPNRHLIALGDPRYPEALLHICDPPTVLYAVGRAELLNAPGLAIVGSRNASTQGVRDAEAFAQELSRNGLCIVSGLALGVDAAAHHGGLEGEGSSVAVIGTGPDLTYPRGNHGLARQLERKGCVVTEHCLGTPPRPENFPRRNRLISGLSRGVLVIEANEGSGSLITARLAAEQGREVFAMPGSIHSALSRGCHKLIREGATLVQTAGDILEELRMARSIQPRAVAKRAAAHPLLSLMGFAPVSIDELAARAGLAAGTVAAQVSRLELDGRIAPLPGGRYQQLERAP